MPTATTPTPTTDATAPTGRPARPGAPAPAAADRAVPPRPRERTPCDREHHRAFVNTLPFATGIRR